MNLANQPATFFEPAAAVKKAAELAAGDPDWTYTATNPDGKLGPFSKISVHDEDGEFIAYI